MSDESPVQAAFSETLRRAAGAVGVPLDDTQIAACERYTALLLETNAHTNLTRITAPAEIAIKHFADSLTVLPAVPGLAKGARVADVGTGAGFPGLVLKIARPDLHVVLIDSLAKRLTFLREVAEALAIDNVTFVHARAEDAGRDPALRDSCDLVVARAVAALPTLLEWCAPLVRPGGHFLALKAASVAAELPAALPATSLLKLKLENDTSLTLPALPHDAEPPALRRLLLYCKTAPTPARFPRRPAEIKASPLR